MRWRTISIVVATIGAGVYPHLVTCTSHEIHLSVNENHTEPLAPFRSLEMPENTRLFPIENDPFLVIGVKTSVVHHAAQRQVIRETWAHPQHLYNLSTRVLFLGCEPDLSTYMEPKERERVHEAIAMEKRVFQDLWTSELECVDSYAQLLTKVVTFMEKIVLNASQSLQYVMIVDDDVYVRLDRVVAMLQRRETPTKRFYAGYVFRDLRPTLNPAHKNYLPENEYPMTMLPPFAGGPHYLLSIDLVHYIARNHLMLQGLRAMDDISIALWLLAIQVHPMHVSSFVLLRTTPCHDDAIAIADLSLSTVRQLHQNVQNNQSLCTNVTTTSAMRRDRTIILPETDETRPSDTILTWEIFQNVSSKILHIGVTIAVATRKVTFDFVPAVETYEVGLCARGASLLLSKLYITVEEPFCAFHRRKLFEFILKAVHDNPNVHGILSLPLHNLAANSPSTIIVSLARGATKARGFVECVIKKVYSTVRILVLNDDVLDVTPDIFIFSDQDERMIGPHVTSKCGHVSRMLMIVDGVRQLERLLDPQISVLTPFKQTIHPKQVFLPIASTAFGTSLQHTPIQLLQPYIHTTTSLALRRFCAYRHDQCDHSRREYMVDLLNDVEPVDVLELYQGDKQRSLSTSDAGARPIESMVSSYTNYKFVIAFEDAVAPGYVTEKIVAAFLAGAIPIYDGHSRTVTRLFNRDAFIDCGDFESLRACTQHVIDIHSSPDKYATMRRAPPVVNRTIFYETFGWHPAVVDDASEHVQIPLIDKLKELLERGDRE